MCQYSSIDGCPSKWHFHHLQNLIETGVGSLVIESTAVSKIGRITPYDLCLYNNLHLRTHRSLINYLKKIRNIPIILQISHSGRKGSAEIPWVKKNFSLNKSKSWVTMAPSSIRRSKKWPRPKEMSKKDITQVINEFKHTAHLAFKAGYDGVEIHMAHGYLIHQFCSPISNKRTDEYKIDSGVSIFPKKILDEISKITPKNKIIGARITATDHLKKGIKLNDCIKLVKQLKQKGLNYICVSSGGIIPKTTMKFYNGYRFKMAHKLKKECKILTRTSGLIKDSQTINKAFNKYKLDFIALGRILIQDKFFLFKKKLVSNEIIKQYKFCFK